MIARVFVGVADPAGTYITRSDVNNKCFPFTTAGNMTLRLQIAHGGRSIKPLTLKLTPEIYKLPINSF